MDGIYTETLKCATSNFVQNVWTEESAPDNCKHALIDVLYKVKGDCKHYLCRDYLWNYCGMYVISVFGKWFQT